MARKSKEVTAEPKKIKKSNGTHEPSPTADAEFEQRLKQVKLEIEQTLLKERPITEKASAAQMSFREANGSMEKEISDFRDYIIAKYSMYHGHNLHSKIAWYFEQMGIGVAYEVEKLNLKNRQERAKQK